MARREEGRERGSAAADRSGTEVPGGKVLLLVCLECGREYQFEGGEEPPDDLTCEKCGNTVFRPFEDTVSPDDVQADFSESTDRDLATDDPAGDATTGDLHDLNNP